MNATPIPKSRTRNRILIIGITLTGITMVILAVIVATWRIRLRKEINVRTAAIQSAGLPTNWEELGKWSKEVPDAENAAFVYTNAIAHILPDTVPNLNGLPLRTETIPEEFRTAMAKAVQMNRSALEIAYTAKAFSQSRYPVNYSKGPLTQLPHLTGLKQLVTLMAYDAAINAESGNSAGAAKVVQSSLAMARSLDGEPLLISQLVAFGLLTTSCSSFERVLFRVQLSDESLKQLSQQFAAADATNRFLRALIGERALTMEFIRLAQDDVKLMVEIANQEQPEEEKISPPSNNPGFGWRALGIFERDRAFYLRAMETYLLIAEAAPPASLGMTNQVEQIENQTHEGFYIISGLFLPQVSNTPEKRAVLHARLRTALTVAAIERWRLVHGGDLPASLNAIVPDFLPSVPIDPFDGISLRFKKLPRGYIVYSIGPNLHDDGGKEQPARGGKRSRDQRNTYDITFTVER